MGILEDMYEQGLRRRRDNKDRGHKTAKGKANQGGRRSQKDISCGKVKPVPIFNEKMKEKK